MSWQCQQDRTHSRERNHHTHERTHAHTHERTHTRTHAYMYTHTHTHTHIFSYICNCRCRKRMPALQAEHTKQQLNKRVQNSLIPYPSPEELHSNDEKDESDAKDKTTRHGEHRSITASIEHEDTSDNDRKESSANTHHQRLQPCKLP